MTQPFISVITVNYNGRRFLKECLRALREQDYPRDRYEIIVVDNASSDGSAEEARDLFPDVRFIMGPKNVGFALGNNVGYRECRGDLVALINNDAVARPGWLRALEDALARRPEMGLASSKLLFMQRMIDLELLSDTFWPAEAIGSSDGRQLGIKVRTIATNGLSDAQVAYGEGFYPEELAGTPDRYRWTDGCARARVSFTGDAGSLPLEIHLDGWRPPQVPESRLTVKAEGVVRAEVRLPRGPMTLPLLLDGGDLERLPRRIQNAGLNAYSDWFAGDRGHGEIDDGRYREEEEVFGACGAAMMVRRRVIEECGLFDPSFFLYYEDVDLALRARARGHGCIYVPSAVVEHYHAGSAVEGSPFFSYNVERNRLAVMCKHAPLSVACSGVASYVAEALRLARREIRRGVFRGRPGTVGGAALLKLRVVASLASRAPALLARRAQIAATRRVPRARIAAWMKERTGPGSRRRVGIYDLHLRTLGGGEKYLAEVASVLSAHYDVDLIAHRPVSKEVIARRLDVELGNVRVVALGNDTELDLTDISMGYDLFINGTHDSELESYAKKSILVCHFPKRRSRKGPYALARDAFFGGGVEYVDGFYAPEAMGEASQRWTCGRGVLRIRNAVGGQGMIVDLRIIEYRSRGVDVRFTLEGKPIPYYELNILPGGITQYKVLVPPGQIPPGRTYFHLAVLSSTWKPWQEGESDQRTLGVIVRDVKLWRPGGRPASFARWRAGYLGGGFLKDASRRFPHIDTYDVILTHSRYSAGWIRHFWGRDARLIYPAIEGVAPRAKKNVVLSVGRFFEGHHNKKHLLMVLAFKALVDEGLKGWEFHLVGGTHEEEHHRRYLERVKLEAEGYPIRIFTNISHEELQCSYGEARIFWHASGHEEDDRRHPERFEHFGISTVEAMLAGAVPVVIGKAGQLEIVEHGVDGFLWSDVATLKRRTSELVHDPELWARMSARAIAKARRFSRQAFRDQLLDLVKEILPS